MVLTVLLILVFCFTAVLPVAAVQPTAKDLVLTAINNFNLGIHEGFYQKSQAEGTLKITRFGGSLTEAIGDYSGAKLKYATIMDDSQNAIKLSFSTDIKGIVHKGDIFLQDNKVIFSKDFFLLLQDFGVDVFANSSAPLADMPEYLYIEDQQLEPFWQQLSSYQNGRLPEEYTELLAFLVEAIPDDCFSLSAGKVTLRLDRDDFVNTIVNLITKVKTESERVADILINLNRYAYEQLGMDPAEMKQKMAAGMKNITVPSREQIEAIISFVEVNDFTCEYSLLPGGPKTLNVDLAFKAPDSSLDGTFAIVLDVAGKKDNLKGSYSIDGQLNIVSGPNIEIACNSNFSYTATVALADTNIDVTARDNSSGKLLLDLGIVDNSVARIATSLDLGIPELTADNSLDISDLIPTPGVSTSVSVVWPEGPDLGLVVNGVALEVKPGIGSQGELTLPARAVLEQLGYQVQWVQPNEIRVLSDEQRLSLFIGQNNYTVNDVERTLPTAPYMEAGTAMLPLSFISSELGAKIDFVEQSLVITN